MHRATTQEQIELRTPSIAYPEPILRRDPTNLLFPENVAHGVAGADTVPPSATPQEEIELGTPSRIAYTEPHLTPKSNTFAVSGASCWGVAGADKVRPQQHPKRKWNWEPPQALLTPTPSYAQDHIITAPRRAPPCPARRPRRRGRTFKYTYIHT